MATVAQEIRRSNTSSIVLSVLLMITGVLAMFIAPIAGLTVTLLFGWLLIFAGVLHLGFARRGQKASIVVGEILLAIAFAAIGVYMLARPLAGLASLTLVIAAYLLVKGVLEGVMAFTLRPAPGSGWLLFDGILTIVVAAIIGGGWPASAAWAVGVLVGVALLSSGLARLMVSVAVRRVIPER
jgi:uncharacterized membrane protein HdeD (DUF308 family)